MCSKGHGQEMKTQSDGALRPSANPRKTTLGGLACRRGLFFASLFGRITLCKFEI